MITAELTPIRSDRFWLPLPSRPALYRLSTDHYPWSEVRSDLEARPMLSAVLEAEQQGRRGRLLWNAGAALGGFDDTRDLGVNELMSAFPRATVQVTLVDPAVAGLAWQCRSAQPEALSAAWPQAQGQLVSSNFSGALLGGEGGEVISFWQSGRPVAGSLPVSGQVQQLSAPQPLGGQALMEFWSKVLLLASAQAGNIAEIWRSSAADLADDHPCLDPFAREVWLEKLSVQAVPDLSATELRDALLAVFDATLRRLRLRLRNLAVAELQASPMWSVSGAGDLI
ncbi:hypothetical protein EHF33_13650 [Deinococcus psychrotolerans]|uniref:Uncharacterized protein n=1 Tax=Deinococcus psychrotolerans TaxID=2489213 RepID=A0A3G8YFC8_9DEIO|nr:hypothetical protein [Deinococcus psychrotolerans]AZI43665.1 hypothetical protein EHF33_13650 [Deinococcus psychrotolerans]